MAKYTMRQVPQGLGKHPSQHPRLISEGRLSTEDLSERMAEGCTFSRAEIEGVLQLLAEELAKRLADGYIVHIDGMGSFRPKLGYRKDVAPPEGEETATRNATSLELADVCFHADRRLVQRTRRACRLQRARIAATRALERVVSGALASYSAIYAPITSSPVANT